MERLGEVGLPSPNTGNQLDKAILQRRRRCLEAALPGSRLLLRAVGTSQLAGQVPASCRHASPLGLPASRASV